MTPEQQAVATANEAFYDALTNRDLPAMERLWFPADWAECVHPGGVALRGWDEVRDGWASIFTGPGTVMVAATDVRVHLVGDIAWVSCTERLASTVDGAHDHVGGARDQHLRAPRRRVAAGAAPRVPGAVCRAPGFWRTGELT